MDCIMKRERSISFQNNLLRFTRLLIIIIIVWKARAHFSIISCVRFFLFLIRLLYFAFGRLLRHPNAYIYPEDYFNRNSKMRRYDLYPRGYCYATK